MRAPALAVCTRSCYVKPPSPHRIAYVGCAEVSPSLQFLSLSNETGGGQEIYLLPTACLYHLPAANGNYPTGGETFVNTPPNAYCSRLKRTLMPKLVVEVGKLSDTSGLFTMRSKKARMITCWVIM